MKKLMLNNISFYTRHKEQLKKIYAGKYLIIHHEKVFGVCNSWWEASRKGLELFREDTFLIKYCI
ncbi:hypothetical protein [Adhaeribacter radiodurans]|uniref:DUF5678 domain-containing protein n=1 Tax=Adhaeribacter radiodurans TaxID=2745197 RepID=A0A7L7L5V4_9BACT|nr:hypothetical protein [Adhaeribacter radiodurans]QMU28197.1 hypothetical protein HUW48_09160 [Adhaeribacter radiodurans]